MYCLNDSFLIPVKAYITIPCLAITTHNLIVVLSLNVQVACFATALRGFAIIYPQEDPVSRLFAKIKAEIGALLPPTLFFLIALHLVALLRALMLKGTGIALGTSASITVAALILGKAVLIADLLPLINRYPDKPLVFNVAWKTTIYFLVSMLIHYLERLVDFWREAGGFIAGNQKMFAEIVWPHFWAIQIFLVVLILGYCAMRELVREIGERKVRQIFFGPVQKPKAP